MAGRTELGTVVYLGFTGFWGLFLSPILLEYTTDSIALAFVLAGGLFVAMSAIGMTTKKDISGWGPILIMALLGAIVISLVNVFLLGSGLLGLLIQIALLVIFLGLTVWETKKMKELAQEAAVRGDAKAAAQVAIIGSIGLYLNLINLFLIILRLFGSRR